MAFRADARVPAWTTGRDITGRRRTRRGRRQRLDLHDGQRIPGSAGVELDLGMGRTAVERSRPTTPRRPPERVGTERLVALGQPNFHRRRRTDSFRRTRQDDDDPHVDRGRQPNNLRGPVAAQRRQLRDRRPARRAIPGGLAVGGRINHFRDEQVRRHVHPHI